MAINDKQKGIKILMIGPRPVGGGGVGGTSVSFSQLVSELGNHEDVILKIIDTGRRRGNSFFQKTHLLVSTALGLFMSVGRVDVISLHASPDGTIYFGPLAYAISKIFRKPIVFRQFGGVLNARYEKGSFFDRTAIKIVLRSDRVLMQTRALMSYFSERFPMAYLEWFPTSRPSGKNEQFQRITKGEKFKFVFLGHVKPSKGIDEIIEASRLLSKYHFRVDIYGSIGDGLQEDFLSGHPNVKYCGILSGKNIMATLSQYDVLLLPTYHSGEGYPGVIIEAYMAGLPVIATRWISIPEIVDDGVSGILIPPKNARALADAMETVMTNKTKLNELRRGVVKYEELFNSERWTRRFLEICREVIH